jgi:uncharacterized RmlC-like cupin family protein
MHEQCQTVVYVLDAECAKQYQNERRNRNEVCNGTFMKRDAVVGTVIAYTPYYPPSDIVSAK